MKKKISPNFFLIALFVAWCAFFVFRSMGGSGYT
jgi:hypothetical protein